MKTCSRDNVRRSPWMQKMVVAVGAIMLASTVSPIMAHAEGNTSSLSSGLSLPGNRKTVSSDEKVLAVGRDGVTRTVKMSDNGAGHAAGLSNHLNLQATDRVEVAKDGQSVALYEKDGALIGKFVSPTVVVDGQEMKGKFSYEKGDLRTNFADGTELPYQCAKANAGKWIWRGAGALVCGATGVATVVGGAACGLGWAGAEDAMNFGRNC